MKKITEKEMLAFIATLVLSPFALALGIVIRVSVALVMAVCESYSDASLAGSKMAEWWREM